MKKTTTHQHNVMLKKIEDLKTIQTNMNDDTDDNVKECLKTSEHATAVNYA